MGIRAERQEKRGWARGGEGQAAAVMRSGCGRCDDKQVVGSEEQDGEDEGREGHYKISSLSLLLLTISPCGCSCCCSSSHSKPAFKA